MSLQGILVSHLFLQGIHLWSFDGLPDQYGQWDVEDVAVAAAAAAATLESSLARPRLGSTGSSTGGILQPVPREQQRSWKLLIVFLLGWWEVIDREGDGSMQFLNFFGVWGIWEEHFYGCHIWTHIPEREFKTWTPLSPKLCETRQTNIYIYIAGKIMQPAMLVHQSVNQPKVSKSGGIRPRGFRVCSVFLFWAQYSIICLHCPTFQFISSGKHDLIELFTIIYSGTVNLNMYYLFELNSISFMLMPWIDSTGYTMIH